MAQSQARKLTKGDIHNFSVFELKHLLSALTMPNHNGLLAKQCRGEMLAAQTVHLDHSLKAC